MQQREQGEQELQRAYEVEATKPPAERNPRVEFEWARLAANDADTCERIARAHNPPPKVHGI